MKYRTEVKQKQVSAGKNAIAHLIKAISYETETSSDIGKLKKNVEAKKVNFSNAMSLIKDIYSQSLKDSVSTKNKEWLYNTVNDLLDASKAAIDGMLIVLEDNKQLEEAKYDTDIINYSNAKRDAYKNINEFTDYITDLEAMVEGDEIEDSLDIDEKTFKGGFCELFHKKLDGKNKAGYNKDTDSVHICPKGTNGETVVVDGLRITLPAKTNLKGKMLDYSDQHWKREALPKGLEKGNEEIFEAYVEKQHKILRNGFWFFNNGKKEYITGAHWLLLQWLKTEAGFFEFRTAHRDIFYFFEAAYVDERSLGVIMGKSRRSGITHVALAFLLAKSLTTSLDEAKKYFFGMTSMTNTYAKTNFDRLGMMFKGLPSFFKPVSSLTGTQIKYEPPEERDSKDKQQRKKDYSDDYMQNNISYKATKNNSYDSYALKLYFGDEWSKWDKPANIITHFDVVKSTLTKGGLIFGKMFIVSTVRGYTGNGIHDKDAQNGDRYKFLYEESKLSTRDKTTKTNSGLYKLFISAIDNYEGSIDKHGYPIHELTTDKQTDVKNRKIKIGAITDIRNNRKKYKDDITRLNEYYREYPIDEADMFRVESANSTLNTDKLTESIDHLEIIEADLNIKRFNLSWEGGVFDTKVIKTYNNKGKFYEYVELPKNLTNNTHIDYNGFKKPLNWDLGCAGIDPYKVSETTDGRHSNGAMHFFTITNSYGIPENTLMVDYIYHPSNVDIFMEDMVMFFFYYGVQGLIENNVTELLRYMKSRGYRKFAMNRPDKNKADLSKHELEIGGIPTTSNGIKQMQLFELEKFVDRYIGDQGEEKFFNKILSKRTLIDWLQLNPSNWTPHDASVSSSLALMGCSSLKATSQKKIEMENNQFNAAKDYFQFYSNRGNKIGRKI